MAEKSEHQPMSFCAGIFSSASAPPMIGENKAQIGGIEKARAVHSDKSSALSIVVKEGIQNPGAIPWQKESSHNLQKTILDKQTGGTRNSLVRKHRFTRFSTKQHSHSKILKLMRSRSRSFIYKTQTNGERSYRWKIYVEKYFA